VGDSDGDLDTGDVDQSRGEARLRAVLESLDVQSEPGRGTAFTLFFPALDQPEGGGLSRAAGDVRTAAAQARRPRVLFVDDEPSIVALGLRILERYGYAPRGYTTSGEAVAALRAQPAGADVLVTDLDMPGMNGFDVAQAAQSIRADLPIVLVSGLLTEEQRRRAAEIGVKATLAKPYDGNELHATLQRVLTQGIDPGDRSS